MSAFKFKLGDRVVTPDGAVGDVVRNAIEPQGELVTVQTTRQENYSAASLQSADPLAGAAVKALKDGSADLHARVSQQAATIDGLNRAIAEVGSECAALRNKLSRPKAKFAKSKKRR